MNRDPIQPGTICYITGAGDLFMEEEARAFIDKLCIVIKVTKSGLIQVALKEDPKKTYSVPRMNVSLL